MHQCNLHSLILTSKYHNIFVFLFTYIHTVHKSVMFSCVQYNVTAPTPCPLLNLPFLDWRSTPKLFSFLVFCFWWDSTKPSLTTTTRIEHVLFSQILTHVKYELFYMIESKGQQNVPKQSSRWYVWVFVWKLSSNLFSQNLSGSDMVTYDVCI